MIFAYDPATNPLNTNEWAFPLCECLHIAAFAFSIGTIGLVDLRMLGLGLTDRSPAQLVRDTEMWTLLGLAVVITSGLAIFSSDPVMYLHNSAFRWKMLALLAGVVYNYTIHRKVALNGGASGAAMAVAGTSLVLWLSMVFLGIFIAFI
jgi:hypothetical protein